VVTAATGRAVASHPGVRGRHRRHHVPGAITRAPAA
jgi:hypothetical protein